MIQRIVDEANNTLAQLHGKQEFSKKVLAVGIEINQRYTEYLDELLDCDLSEPEGVTVNVDGKKIHFPSAENFSAWLAESMT